MNAVLFLLGDCVTRNVSEIRFFAPATWRGRVKTADVRRLLRYHTPGRSLPADPGAGSFQAKVRLNRDQVRRLAGAAGRDVSGFLRCLLASRMPAAPARRPVEPATPRTNLLQNLPPRFSPTPSTVAATTPTRSAVTRQARPAEDKIFPAYCSRCGIYREGVMKGIPPQFSCLTCGGS